jgi:diacylglycerol O-acyltransferase
MERFMRESDAFSWYMEGDPVLRSTVVAVTWLERSPGLAALSARLERSTRVLPAFRQRPVAPPARLTVPRWTVDPEFDLSWHLRQINAPPPHDYSVVLDFARREAMTGFDRAHPLWQFTLIDGLEDGRAALVMKLHHSLTDGVGGMELALTLYDQTPDPDPPAGPAPKPPMGEYPTAIGLIAEHAMWRAGTTARLAGRQIMGALPAATHTLRHPLTTTRQTVELARSIGRTVAPVRRTLSPIMSRRGLGRHLGLIEVGLDELKAASRAAGGSINDGFIAAVAGGLRIYHERHGARIQALRVTMPISIRAPGDPAGGNRITLMRFPIPAGETDPARRIQAIGQHARAARNERSLPLTNSIAGALNLLPPAAIGGMLKHVDFLASDVPGFTAPVYLGGAKVERYTAFGPTTGTAVNVTLISYCGRCYAGVTIDTAAVPDPGLLLDCLDQGFAEVLALVPKRRIDHARKRRPRPPAPEVLGEQLDRTAAGIRRAPRNVGGEADPGMPVERVPVG